MGTLAEQASKLLDFTQRLDIQLLDNVVGCMYTGLGEQVNVIIRTFLFNHFKNNILNCERKLLNLYLTILKIKRKISFE